MGQLMKQWCAEGNQHTLWTADRHYNLQKAEADAAAGKRISEEVASTFILAASFLFGVL